MDAPSPITESVLKKRLSELGSARNLDPRILSELESFIRTADDYDLFRVNPIQYGCTAGLSEADAIELFIHASKVGLFEMDWLLLCACCPQVAGSFRELRRNPAALELDIVQPPGEDHDRQDRGDEQE